MNKWPILLYILLLTLSACAPAPERIDWTPMDPALMKQQETRQPILFYFYATGTMYCEMMARSTFLDDCVVDLVNRNYIPVRVHLNQRATRDLPSGRRLAEAFQIKSVPALVVVDADHRAVDTRIGFVTARAACEFLETNINPLVLPAEPEAGQP